MIKSYKFKIRKPSKAIIARFEQTLDLCRELYNAALQERRDAWKLNRVSVSYFDQTKQLPEIKIVREELSGVYSQVLSDVLKRLDKTFKAFFWRVKRGEKAGFPRFKSKNRYDSFCFSQSGWKLEDDKLTLSKIGTVRVRLSLRIRGKVKTCTIKREVDGWFVVITAEAEPKILPKTGKSTGVDVGLESFATLSTGEQIENHKFLRQSERRLKNAQRSVSRKKRGGKNRKKAVVLLRKQHLKIKRQRLDFLHKTALKLVKEFDEIAVENLQIRNMVKNHHLAKSITDASWGNLLRILECKAENAGKRVWRVDAKNTSQECSNCGVKVSKTLKQRKHSCQGCGLELHRDHNAAINIQRRADALLMSQITAASDAVISSQTF